MIEKGQVFVRGKKKNGRWGNIDVMDLDEYSFRRFILTLLNRAGPAISSCYFEGDFRNILCKEPLRERSEVKDEDARI